ncbi:MAG TPA: hypothetical protein VF520_09465 [Thermoleophilaceae bacterium]|jgi:hypothetical protein
MKGLLAAVLAGSLALGLVACGGDDGVSKADYIEKADAICAQGDKENQAIVEKSFEDQQDPQPEEAQSAIREVVPLQKARLAKLRELEKPDGDESKLDAIYTAVQAGIASLEQAGQDPTASLAILKSQRGPFDAADRLAKDYGFKDCAN